MILQTVLYRLDLWTQWFLIAYVYITYPALVIRVFAGINGWPWRATNKLTWFQILHEVLFYHPAVWLIPRQETCIVGKESAPLAQLETLMLTLIYSIRPKILFFCAIRHLTIGGCELGTGIYHDDISFGATRPPRHLQYTYKEKIEGRTFHYWQFPSLEYLYATVLI